MMIHTGTRCLILVLMSIFAVIWCAGSAFSQENQFYDDPQEMVEALSQPNPRTRGLSRSFLPDAPAKTRTIVVLAREKNQDVPRTLVVTKADDIPRINLKVEFDYNSSTLRPGAYSILKSLGQALGHKALEKKTITILGHTDSDGLKPYNLALSLKRAAAVKNYLTGNFDLPAQRIEILGYGEQMPLVPNDTPSNKQINRRVEIRAR